MNLKKVSLLGCKMKVYQERLRQIQFLEVISRFKRVHSLESVADLHPDDLALKLEFCEQMARKVQTSLISNQVELQLLHEDLSLPASMAMSVMTNGVYSSCEVWSAFNKMAAYSMRQDRSLTLLNKNTHKFKPLFQTFSQVRANDFDTKVKTMLTLNQDGDPDQIVN